jgi:heptosyltransferase-2/heptosyltransferase-3
LKTQVRLRILQAIGALPRLRGISPPSATTHAPRLLVLRPDHLGDVLLSRPAIDALQAALPHARITLAVGPWGRPALGNVPPDSLLLCPFPGFARSATGPLRPYALLLHYTILLRRQHYDAAVILRPDHWWGALLATLAGIPVRIGYRTPETSPFLTACLPLAGGTHAVKQALALAAATAQIYGGALPENPIRLRPIATAADREQARAVLAEAGIADSIPLLVLHPGSGAALKAWPLDSFAAAGARIATAIGARVVVTGSTAEHEQAARLCAQLPGAVNLVGGLSWGGLEAVLARADLVVGVDSGPLHLAVAAGTPSVVLFGPADPAQFAPWGSPARHRLMAADLPCRPCRRLDYCALEPDCTGPPPCMRAIVVDDVVHTALQAGNAKEHDAVPIG